MRIIVGTWKMFAIMVRVLTDGTSHANRNSVELLGIWTDGWQVITDIVLWNEKCDMTTLSDTQEPTINNMYFYLPTEVPVSRKEKTS